MSALKVKVNEDGTVSFDKEAFNKMSLADCIRALTEAKYRNPKPTVDIVVLMNNAPHPEDLKFVLVKRKNPPYGWALPGGFVNEGESYETAAIRETKEEIGLDVDLEQQFYTYSTPDRDPRQHTASTVYIAGPVDVGDPVAGDDAGEVRVVTFREAFEMDLAFDHKRILSDVIDYFYAGIRPTPD